MIEITLCYSSRPVTVQAGLLFTGCALNSNPSDGFVPCCSGACEHQPCNFCDKRGETSRRRKSHL